MRVYTKYLKYEWKMSYVICHMFEHQSEQCGIGPDVVVSREPCIRVTALCTFTWQAFSTSDKPVMHTRRMRSSIKHETRYVQGTLWDPNMWGWCGLWFVRNALQYQVRIPTTLCIWYRTTRGLKLCHYHWLSYNKLAKPLAMRKCSFRHPSSWHLTQTRSHGQVLRGRFKAWIFIPDPQPSISWHNLRHGTGTLIREYARFAHTLVVSSKIIMKAIASSVVFLF